MKYNTAILTAVAVSIVSVHATPLNIHTRAAETEVAPVISCIRQKYPGFPKGNRPDDEVLRDCMTHSQQPKAKRVDTQPHNTELNELIYEPDDTTNAVTPRGAPITDTIEVLGQTMALASKAMCGRSLHDEFVWTRDLQADAVRICNDLMADVNKKGITESGGVGVIIDQLGIGHDKQGHQLKDGVKLTATWMLNLSQGANSTLIRVEYSVRDRNFVQLRTSWNGVGWNKTSPVGCNYILWSDLLQIWTCFSRD